MSSKRDQMVLRLAEDLEDSLLNDREFRASFCADQFRHMTEAELRQAASDAGLGLPCEAEGCDNFTTCGYCSGCYCDEHDALFTECGCLEDGD